MYLINLYAKYILDSTQCIAGEGCVGARNDAVLPGSLKQPWPDPGLSLRLTIIITIGEPNGSTLYHRWQLVQKKHRWLEGKEERTTGSSHFAASQQHK